MRRFWSALSVSIVVLISGSCQQSATATSTQVSSAEPTVESDALAISSAAAANMSDVPPSTKPTQSSSIAVVPLFTRPLGAVTLLDRGVGNLMVDSVAGCVYLQPMIYIESPHAWGDVMSNGTNERYFLGWLDGTRATTEGVTTYLGEFIPDGERVLWYGSSAPLDSEARPNVYEFVDPAFHHCLVGATHVIYPGPVRPACLECNTPRPWPEPGLPHYLDPTCYAPLC